MTLEEFRATVGDAAPPRVHAALQALWHDARGDWNEAHRVAQDVPDSDGGAWVHAYLHRKEGDLANAGYWYRRAGKPQATVSVEDERQAISKALAQL